MAGLERVMTEADIAAVGYRKGTGAGDLVVLDGSGRVPLQLLPAVVLAELDALRAQVDALLEGGGGTVPTATLANTEDNSQLPGTSILGWAAFADVARVDFARLGTNSTTGNGDPVAVQVAEFRAMQAALEGGTVTPTLANTAPTSQLLGTQVQGWAAAAAAYRARLAALGFPVSSNDNRSIAIMAAELLAAVSAAETGTPPAPSVTLTVGAISTVAEGNPTQQVTLTVGAIASAAEGSPSQQITLTVGSIAAAAEGTPVTLTVGAIASAAEGN